MSERFIGIDVGAETVKLVELSRTNGTLAWTRRAIIEHHKKPGETVLQALAEWDWAQVTGAAVSGRLSRQFDLARVPTKQAQATGFRFLHDGQPATVVSIGSHGFSVLELRSKDMEVFRENSRCSQGTGNFLRQLVERFDMSIEEASEVCAPVENPAPLSGRCPVILKTDMTHLANKGEDRSKILAGLYDAVCENVQVLIKPNVSPKHLLLVGGVSRAERIRNNFRRFAARNEMELINENWEDAFYVEALGSAQVASEQAGRVPALDQLILPAEDASFELLPGLSSYAKMVTRMPKVPLPEVGEGRKVILGFDIGSTGSKGVAVDVHTKEVVWEGYGNTLGNPVGAAQSLMKQFSVGRASKCQLVAFGATGSGREIVGSLMSSAYGVEYVYVLNEIAAHAEGALHFDKRVDTIFEIGGQDAKYIRLAAGRVIDAAMNEACSAGTGSFIEEQGRKFEGIQDVVQLGQEALNADHGVSLGQHCSVFMAEIIDGAVAAGVDNKPILAGIYDSIIQNYLNRVKGSRSVGDVIFCQGMPFSADALASAVARQTGSQVIIPPNPGTVGALGIALLTLKAVNLDALDVSLDPERFLAAEVTSKDTFPCKSNQGCGGGGNYCRIDRIATIVSGKKHRFTWGGGCSLWDRGTGKVKLPDLTPDPFREREAIFQAMLARLTEKRDRPRVGITDTFQLKGLFPFFATFIYELGFDLEVQRGESHEALKRGIERANIPFCAPMQHYHGIVTEMAEKRPDYLFLPMLRNVERSEHEKHSVVCPIVQASSDILSWDIGDEIKTPVLSPVINVGPGLDSREFTESCARVAADLGVVTVRWWRAYERAIEAQRGFEEACYELGRNALAFAKQNNIVPVIVLGRPYTIYNKVLNSNVPPLLREQGALAIPVDCYPIDDEVPYFERMYWGFGQRNLRASHQIRRSAGVYSMWTSNYSCGPDSFNIHFYSYIMQGKPFAIIETDGHSGDAGTKTRVEAFLHCVREDLASVHDAGEALNSFERINSESHSFDDIRRNRETVLIPRMGSGAEALAACMRALDIRAEALPIPDHEVVRTGRRYTSGKECVPMTITLGSLLERLEKARDTDERFAFFMPTANGPCRFGVYNLLHKIVLERLDWKDRVAIWSPADSDYFEDVPAGFTALVFAGFAAADMLLAALYDVRPVETRPGAAQEIFERYSKSLHSVLENTGRKLLSVPASLVQVASGKLFGCAELLRQAGREFAAIKRTEERPTVMMVGEIYARCDPAANDFVVEKLEERGISVRFAPFVEWLEYTDFSNRLEARSIGFGDHLSSFVQRRTLDLTYSAIGDLLDWPDRPSMKETVRAAEPWVRKELLGEAVLTVGGPVHEWREGLIDGVVSVGPLECMPNKIAESQFYHIAEREGLTSLTIALNGDPIDPEVLDNFAFEIKQRFAERGKRPVPQHKSGPARQRQAS